MTHINNVYRLYREYGLEYEGYYASPKDPLNYNILYARFYDKNGKEIWRKIYKKRDDKYVKFFGVNWFFD